MWGTDRQRAVSVSEYARGDVDAALAASAHVVHEVFQTQRIEHAFLEPESTLAVPTGDRRCTPRCTCTPAARACGTTATTSPACSPSATTQVTVELVSNGGAFGGKEDMSNQAHDRAGRVAARPAGEVHAVARGELPHARQAPPDPPRVLGRAATPTGTLTAVQVRGIGDSGAYASVGMKVLERAAGHASGPYRVPDIDVRADRGAHQQPVCGAFRGFGANQAQFAMEGVLDRLAAQVGISGWEIRKRNVIHPGEVWGPGPDHGRRLPAAPRRASTRSSRTYDAAPRRRQGGRARARA